MKPAPFPTWKPLFWVFSALLPLTMLCFEVAQILLFETLRAPNVSSAQQIGWMALFYMQWPVVPRIIWAIAVRSENLRITSLTALSVRVLAVALILSSVHLLMLAAILRYMHSPPGWGAAELASSFGEVWFVYGDDWLLAFLAATALILWWQWQFRQSTVRKIEVKDANRTIWVDPANVIWVRAAGNYSEIVTKEAVYSVNMSLANLALALGNRFLQTHRSALVNSGSILEIAARAHGSGYTIHLEGGKQAPLSRRNLAVVKQRIRKLNLTI